MEKFSAWVLGDEIAQRFGGASVGVPTGGGYAVGNRLVDAYLAQTGLTAADALHVPSAEIRAATPSAAAAGEGARRTRGAVSEEVPRGASPKAPRGGTPRAPTHKSTDA